ncbi:GNAT family N-acetyltransferase [Paucibacter sp. APW11]|uniref:GNAT family N-acetyltransferase n=1 Tax=Roseateles aquae TaxID=3077235 RepID=A0ABU3PAK1_9BURK|nr:GNAT family N-acetyltransferase [Paucibacter sp. APW11]MDT8999128.1 GNAT family N-acetyltransferase [Paucibacter sp. APW11]
MTMEIRGLRPEDRGAWEVLARGYKRFYETELSDQDYEQAWQKLQLGQQVQALVADVNGQVQGLAHYLFHASSWSDSVCYLQDLFVAEPARGRGLAAALIAAVGERAAAAGAARCYWLTHRDNARARALYDRVGEHRGFVRYDLPMA